MWSRPLTNIGTPISSFKPLKGLSKTLGMTARYLSTLKQSTPHNNQPTSLNNPLVSPDIMSSISSSSNNHNINHFSSHTQSKLPDDLITKHNPTSLSIDNTTNHIKNNTISLNAPDTKTNLNEIPTVKKFLYKSDWYQQLKEDQQSRVQKFVEPIDSIFGSHYQRRYIRDEYMKTGVMRSIHTNRPLSPYSSIPPYHHYDAEDAPYRPNDYSGYRVMNIEDVQRLLQPEKPKYPRPAVKRSSEISVIVAMVGNAVVCVAKFFTATYSSSGVMFAEAVHSLADVINQGLLYVGLRISRQRASATHPYGYGAAQFAYALVSATGVFFFGCGASLHHGLVQLFDNSPHVVDITPLVVDILIFSALVEGATCTYACYTIHNLAKTANMKFFEYLRDGNDSSAIAVAIEDIFAVVGLTLALITLYLTHITGDSIYDTIGTLTIGMCMGLVAIFLINKNMHLLIGRSFNHGTNKNIISYLTRRSTIVDIHDVKTVSYGDHDHRFKAEIHFHGRQLARQVMFGVPIEIDDVTLPIPPQTPGGIAGRWLLEILQEKQRPVLTKEQATNILLTFGDEVVQEVAREVDNVEKQLHSQFKFITHVDLESHVPTVDEDQSEVHMYGILETIRDYEQSSRIRGQDVKSTLNNEMVYGIGNPIYLPTIRIKESILRELESRTKISK